jgi:hypothetical protein
MGAPEVIADVFAGIAATAGALSVWLARRTVSEARSATAQLEKANTDAERRFGVESHHRVLMQFQAISDLVAELGRAASPRSVAAPARAERYHAIRRQLLGAIVVLRNLGGPDLSEDLAAVTSNTIDFASPNEIEVAQATVVLALQLLEDR